MISLSYDIHIHSCLSPCGDKDMTPCNIAGMAFLNKLDIIALTDHNSAKNCPAFKSAAENYGLIPLFGMELTTVEEVHVVCLFDRLEAALEWDSFVYNKIIPVKNDPEIFGTQTILDKNDEIIKTEPLLLINATNISFLKVFELIKPFGGIAFPAHVDKQANSLISNLGFVPPEADFHTAEIKNISKKDSILNAHPYFKDCNIISNSDAHYLTDINTDVNYLSVEERSAAAVINSLDRIAFANTQI